MSGPVGLTCGQCKWAKFNAKEVTKRICYGMPPMPVVLPHPQGVQTAMVRPMVDAKEEACAQFAPRENLLGAPIVVEEKAVAS